MVKLKLAVLLIVVASLIGCDSQDIENACVGYDEVCAKFKNDKPVELIVSFNEGTDNKEFVSRLKAQGIEVVTEYDVVPQVHVKLTPEQFVYVRSLQEVKVIELNRFHKITPVLPIPQ